LSGREKERQGGQAGGAASRGRGRLPTEQGTLFRAESIPGS